MLAIRLPQDIEKRLETLARRTGRTKTFYVREAILQHLEDLEDMCALIGGDMARLDRRWSLRTVRDDATGVEVEATARDTAKAALRTMTFALTADMTRPTHVALVEGPHDRTDILFGELRINEPIDEAGMRPP